MVLTHTKSLTMPRTHLDLTRNCMQRPRPCGSNCPLQRNCYSQKMAMGSGMAKDLDHHRSIRTTGNLVDCSCNWRCTKSPLPVC